MPLRTNCVMLRGLFMLGLLVGLVTALYADPGKCNDGSTPLTTLNFHFSGDSYRPGSNCNAAGCTDRLVMGGSGTIHGRFCKGETATAGRVTAQGSFAHYDISLPPGNNIPLKFTGTWKATNLVSFKLLGLYGTDSQGVFPLAAGVLVLDIVLVRPATTLIPLTRVPSLLTVVSNLQPSGVMSSGQPDGVTLLAPNSPQGFFFIPIPVDSVPLPGGLTMEAHTPVLFSTLHEDRNEPPPTPESD
jgi:hypothetical protein